MNKITIIKAIILLASNMLTMRSFGHSYYISNSGNDNKNGWSAQTAWKTLNRLTKVKLVAGDSVFLQRGDTFRGTIYIKASGSSIHPIVITAYGKGNAPVLSGAAIVKQWQFTNPARLEASIPQKVYDIFSKKRRFTPARFPNSSWLTIDRGVGKDSIIAQQLIQPEDYWNGATLRIRSVDWAYETRAIAKYTKGMLIQAPQNRYPVEKGFESRTRNGQTGLYEFKKGYGFYLEGLPAMVDTAGEWNWHNGKLLVQTAENELNEGDHLEAVTELTGIKLNPNVNHIIIDALSFKYFEKAGIQGGDHLKGIIIKNNYFSQIHGAGILLDSASVNCKITGNSFSDILGRGISVLEPTYMEIAENKICRIGLIRGQGWSGVNGATGILIHNIERVKQTDTTFARHNIVRYNRVDSCGYNGIRVDGSFNRVEYNVIDHCSMTLNDGANLYCFGKGPGVNHHSIFKKNIIRYSKGDIQGTPGQSRLAFGIYIDNNSSDMLVDSNTVISTAAAGIFNNDASFNNTFSNNIVFDCKDGIGFAEWANIGKIYGLNVYQNTVVGLTAKQKMASMTNWLAPRLNVGTLKSNLYINLYATACFSYTTKQMPEATQLDLSFEQWQRVLANDYKSKSISASAGYTKNMTTIIIVNDKRLDEVYEQGKTQLLELDGKPVNRPIVLSPFTSKVLFQQEIIK